MKLGHLASRTLRGGPGRHTGAVAAVLTVLAWSLAAGAHSAGLSVGDYQWRERSLHAVLGFARADLDAAWPRALSGDGSWVTLLAHESAAKTWVRERLRVRRAGGACTGSDGTMRLDGDGVSFEVTYVCPAGGDELTIDAAFLRDFARHHQHVLRLRLGDEQVDRVLTEQAPYLTIALAAPSRAAVWWVMAGGAAAAAGALVWRGRRAHGPHPRPLGALRPGRRTRNARSSSRAPD